MDWKQKYIRLLEKLTQRSAWQKDHLMDISCLGFAFLFLHLLLLFYSGHYQTTHSL